MVNKIGRNDPCSCGSGKKYKYCCITNAFSLPKGSSDLAWQKVREIEGAVVDNHLRQYVSQLGSDELIPHALADFGFDELPETMDKEVIFNQFFIPWMLFSWRIGHSITLLFVGMPYVLSRRILN